MVGLTLASCASALAQEVTVRFNLNYKTKEKAPVALTVKQGTALRLQDKPVPRYDGRAEVSDQSAEHRQDE